MSSLNDRRPNTGKLALALLATLYSSGVLAASGLDDPTDFKHLAKMGFDATVPLKPGFTDTEIGLQNLTDNVGDIRNSYAWSMAWFNNQLYVGTLRNQHCTVGNDGNDSVCAAFDSTGYPDATWKGEIWRYAPKAGDPRNGTWTRVFQSPNISYGTILEYVAGIPATTPRDIGYRMMTVCNAGDGVERLYVATAGIPANILYHNAGTNTFSATSTQGTYNTILNLYNQDFDLSYRALTCFKGRLWTSPVGAPNMTDVTQSDPDASLHPVVLMNPGPASGQRWQEMINVQTTAPINGPIDGGNGGIFQMEAIGDYLYLSVGNRTTGLEIWRGDGTKCLPPWQGGCTMTWERLIDNGAGRPNDGSDGRSNPVIDNAGATLGVFGNDLYIGAAESGYADSTRPELLRIKNANTASPKWELLVGWPRVGAAANPSPLGANFNCLNTGTVDPVDFWDDTAVCKDWHGIVIDCPMKWLKDLADADPTTNIDCFPASGFGPGMGTKPAYDFNFPWPYTSGSSNYFWRFQEYKGEFFMGTLGGGNAKYLGPDQDAPRPTDVNGDLFCTRGGWGGRGNGALLLNITSDIKYQVLFSDGLGNPQNNGIRTFAAMPFGLAIGTANYGFNDHPIISYQVTRILLEDGTTPDSTLIENPAAYDIQGSEAFRCVRTEGPTLRTDLNGYQVAGTNIIVGPNAIVDSTVPSVSITFPLRTTTTNAYTAATFATGCGTAYNDVCGTASDNDAVFAVEVSVYNVGTRRWLSGTTFNSTTQKWVKADIAKQDGLLTYDWKYPLSLAAGTYDLTVRATDYAGKQKTATVRFTRK